MGGFFSTETVATSSNDVEVDKTTAIIPVLECAKQPNLFEQDIMAAAEQQPLCKCDENYDTAFNKCACCLHEYSLYTFYDFYLIFRNLRVNHNLLRKIYYEVLEYNNSDLTFNSEFCFIENIRTKNYRLTVLLIILMMKKIKSVSHHNCKLLLTYKKMVDFLEPEYRNIPFVKKNCDNFRCKM